MYCIAVIVVILS